MSTTPTQADWDAARAEAEKVRSEIQNGADFKSRGREVLRRRRHQGVGRRAGPGDQRADGSSLRGSGVRALQKGELSEPVKTQYGYHLIEVTDITPEDQLAFDQVKENIKSTLLE